jgi:3-methyladenine DNA glycosylase AlkD
MLKTHSLLEKLRRAMRRARDPARAIAQQAYMKSTMPYHGVANPQMRTICRAVFADYAIDPKRWPSDILEIWRNARFREERYAAIELAQLRKARPLHTIDALPIFEEIIVDGAWWDFVDAVAGKNLGLILENDRAAMRRKMLAWSKCDDMWKRRSSIICQLHFKEKTDLDFLYTCIEPSLSSKEFFLRKAIGWALRQYAWTDPGEIVRYVEANAERLSPLSRREALKNFTSSHASDPRGARRKNA